MDLDTQASQISRVHMGLAEGAENKSTRMKGKESLASEKNISKVKKGGTQ